MEFRSISMFDGIHLVMAVLLATAWSQTNAPTTPPQTTTTPPPPPTTASPPPFTTTAPPPPTTTPPTTTTTTTQSFFYNGPELCDICSMEITLCNNNQGCTAMFGCEQIGVEDFTHCNPIGDSVFCSETNGGLETLTAEVKDQLKKQRRRFKKYWPCFKGILSPIKGFVINLDVCTGNPYSEGRAIVQEMSDLFLEKELTLTQILRHITNKISPPLGYSGTFFSTWANVLTRMADTVEKMTLDELEDMLGCKCFRRLSRPCF